MPGDHVIGEQAKPLQVAARGEELKGADPHMARRDARQHGTRQQRLARDRLSGHHGCERTRRRDAQGRHGFADDEFAQHRSERRAPVTAARKRRAARPFELDVPADAVAVDDLPEQDRASVAELVHEMPELVPGVSHRDGLGGVRHTRAGENREALRTGQPVRVETKMKREF